MEWKGLTLLHSEWPKLNRVLAILSAIRLKLVFILSKEAKTKIPAVIENKKGELGNEMGKLDRVIVKDILDLLHSVKTFNSLRILIV